MSVFKRNRKEAQLILLFATVKFILHLFANSNFGFHRDELLHLALGDHLAWGYKEVPPFIGFISWLGTTLFGDSVFAARLIPTLAGAATVYITGLMVLTLGGKRFAISVACLGMIFSPAFMASQYLLQPVVFDQLFWVISAYLSIKYIQTRHSSYLYWLGLTIGMGMLTKYTMALYAAALFMSILFSSQRKALFTKHVLGAGLVALLVFLPNIIWQLTNGVPLIHHLKELNTTQLNNVNPSDFILEQFILHAMGLFIWLPGVIYLFFSRVRIKFFFLSSAFLITMFLLVILHGKIYYGFGAYPALFACGGIAWEKLLSRLNKKARYATLVVTLSPALLLMPILIPILPLSSSLKFFDFTSKKMGLMFPLKWEDQKYHATTQDYADMLGWEEMAISTSKAYHGLTEKQKRSTTIFATNYGIAGAIDHYGKKYGLPKVVCLNSSFALWAPDSIETEHIIYIDTDALDIGRAFKSIVKVGEVTNPYAREKGTGTYLLSEPIADVNKVYRVHLDSTRAKASPILH